MSRLETAKSFILSLASTLVLYLSGVTIPLAGFLLILFVPQPPLGFGLRHGRALGIALPILACLVLFLLGGKALALGYFPLALMAMLLLFFFGRGWAVGTIVAGAAAGTVLAGLSVLLSLFGSLSVLRQAAQETLRENLEISLRIYEKFGFSGEGLGLLRERSPQVIDAILQAMPALTFAGFVAVILLNLFLLYRRFPHIRGEHLPAGDLREWKSPEPLVWCFIFSGFALFLPPQWGLKVLVLNLFIASAVFYFFQGLAIVSYYFHYKNIPWFFRALGYGLIAFEQVFTLFVVGLGLFDLWGDFRRLNRKNLTPSGVS